MEVDAGQVNGIVNGTNDEQADEQSVSPDISDVYDVFGDPDIFPRVGEEYQVEIPPLISKFDYCWFQRSTHEAESTASTLHKFHVGLPIPLIWIKDKAENNKHGPRKSECKSTGVIDKIESPKLECVGMTKNGPQLQTIDSTFSNGVKFGELENSDVHHETKMGMHEEHRDKGHCLVPGFASDAWTETEEASFILGLYVFGKNLAQVKRFIGNKRMGDILSFYYGKFYKSDKYQRWSGCRKNKSRKYISGQKIFTGPRHQELMSRLLPNASEECRNELLEVSKTFIEGKMLLEDYVLALKASVGLKALVEGVGIGKGKEDLTGLSVDSVKSTQAIAVRQEIPVGKACSMLIPSEIVRFLTGGSRLSKARTSDLFWEAIWPRLLARGWHSEQPGNYNYAVASKNPLVFLVPGVKKFSRKLVKGNHYFDSVTDVLGKVASDPELIDLETHAYKDNDCTRKEENGWTKDINLDRDNSPDQPRHCYLKVKTPNRITNVMKFTVVDASLASGKVRKIRELRSLPFRVLNASVVEEDSDDENTSEELIHESESCFDSGKNDITEVSKYKTVKGASSDLNGLESDPSKEELQRSNVICTSLSAALIDLKKTDFLGNTETGDGLKRESLQTIISSNKNGLVPVTKRRRRLTACSRSKKHSNATNFFEVPRVKQDVSSICVDLDDSRYSENVIADFVAPKVKQDKVTYCPYNSKLSDHVQSRVIPTRENNSLAGFPTQKKIKTSADPLSKPSSIICKVTVPDTSSSGTKDQNQKPQPQRTMIDLNLPVSPEDDIDEPFVREETELHKGDTRKESGDLSVGTNSVPEDHSDQQPDIHSRRQSTRNRPPTTRALEAFAFGYLDKKEKRRSRDSLGSRPSRCIRRKVEGSSSGRVGFGIEERTNVVCNGNGNGSCSSNSNSDVICTGFKCQELSSILD